MSIDITVAGNALPTQGVIRDTFVLIGGWASLQDWQNSEATPLPPTPAYSASGDLLRRVQGNELNPPTGHVITAIGLKGRMSDLDVEGAFNFINSVFDPRGKLIISGHSMGGAAAQRLCRKIDSDGPFFDLRNGGLSKEPRSSGASYEFRKPLFPFPSGTPDVPPPAAVPGPPGQRPMDKFSAPANPRARVDLLVTVDAAIGNFSASLDRSIPQCVRTNLNYYQTTRKGTEESFGGPNRAIDPLKTIVWNHDLTNRMLASPDPSQPPSKPDHYSIQVQCNNLVMKIFQQALNVERVTDFWDVTT